MYFLDRKYINFDQIVHKVHIDNIAADNGLEPIRRQAIIWTNGDQVYWRIYASFGFIELN